ncbi:DUF952 domain-containing protein [Rhodococcoides kyotonense]|nr:DUF952 domain-containing protein [Rhodococcus kyotonensis]
MCSAEEWVSAQASGFRRPADYDETGFIHLSTPEQVHLPAGRLFAGRRDIVLLVLDPELLASPVRWEPGVADDPESMLFPHLYGPLPSAAVTAVQGYLPDSDGSFAPPAL